MKKDTKRILKIFVSHQSLNRHPLLSEACKILEEEKDKINQEYRGEEKDDLLEIKFLDFQRWHTIANPHNSPFQSAKSLRKDAANCNAVFFLIDEDFSPRVKKWYDLQIRRESKENNERRVPLPVFWNILDPESAKKCNAYFFDDDSDYINRYRTMEELRPIVAKKLSQLAKRWATQIEHKRTPPTLASNRKRRCFIRGLEFCALAAAIYFSWHLIQKAFCPGPANDPARTLLKERIDNVKSMVSAEQFAPALDTLAVLDQACNPVWHAERNTIDSLKQVALDGKALDEQARAAIGKRIAEVRAIIAGSKYDKARVLAILNAIEKDCKPWWEEEMAKIKVLRKDLRGDTPPPPPPVPTIDLNGYVIQATPATFLSGLDTGISERIPSLRPNAEGTVPRWTITVTEDPVVIEAPKTMEGQPTIVTVSFSVAIKDATGEKRIPSTPVTQSEQGWSREEAIVEARKAAVPRIIDIIKERIK